MRLNKILALSAAVAALTTAALAQVVTYPPSNISLGNLQIDINDPDQVTDFFFEVTPNPEFWSAAPAQSYAAIVLRLAYDPTKVELQYFLGGSWRNVSALAVGGTQNIRVQPNITALQASLGRKSAPGGLVIVELGFAGPNQTGPTSGPIWGTGTGAAFRPLRWKNVGLSLNQTYNFPDFGGTWGETKYGQIIKLADPDAGTPNQRSIFNLYTGGITVVPEPASMIALGSGLVGLLALRRRKK